MDKRDTFQIFIVLTVISVLMISVNTIPVFRVFKNILIKIIYDGTDVIDWPVGKAASIYSRAKNFFNLYDENIRLKSEIAQLKNNYMDMDFLKQENKSLHDLLDYEVADTGKLVPAKILVQNPYNYFIELTINKGELHGIKKDFPIITIVDSRWVLSGRVGEVFKEYSKIVLITSYDFRCGAEFGDKYRGVIKGNNGWMLNLEYISPEAAVSIGDEVYSSGTGGVFPAGLFIGHVADVKNLNFSTGKQATVKSFCYPQNAKNVYVLVNHK